MAVCKMTYFYMWATISAYTYSLFWALIKWGPVMVEVGHFPRDLSTEQQALF